MTEATEAQPESEELTFPREVGTTFNADRFVVDEAEYTDLKRLGVLVDDGLEKAETAVEPTPSTSPAKPATSPATPASTVTGTTNTEGAPA